MKILYKDTKGKKIIKKNDIQDEGMILLNQKNIEDIIKNEWLKKLLIVVVEFITDFYVVVIDVEQDYKKKISLCNKRGKVVWTGPFMNEDFIIQTIRTKSGGKIPEIAEESTAAA